MGEGLANVARRALRVRGVVQGVGFRPAMYRLAQALELGGFVRNDADGVLLEIEGDPIVLSRFAEQLRQAAPRRAQVASMESVEVSPLGEREFRIASSPSDAAALHTAAIPIDLAPCEACLRELADPSDRRHRYPFINCTDCGPRFTIVRSVPYDRARTTMDGFALCECCQREYDDPGDRRFHAEPNACPACGPTARLIDGDRTSVGDDPVTLAAQRLREGAIVAVKGVGGYALAVDATREASVRRLRRRKHRPHKPFAVMARDLAHARRIAEIDDAAADALTSPARPIVLVPARHHGPLAASVAPKLRDVGVFLPPTPLQRLLADDGPPLLVMTSGNHADEPIARDEREAFARLGDIADAFLTHDRPIHSRADESIVRMIDGAPAPLRRARGFVPDAIELPVSLDAPLLAVGGELRGTICLAHGDRAVLSQHLGHLSNADAYAFFTEAVAHLSELVGVDPARVAHDLHPEYRSTRWALASGLPTVGVQHHHAHVAACLAEHGRDELVLGVAFDGTGYGDDGGVWGGEILEASLHGFRRVAHLRPLALPGGERAIRQPWRLALAALRDAGLGADALDGVDPVRVQRVDRLFDAGVATKVTSSGAGRWFDAVAALLGVRSEITYDAQAAMELEAIAAPGVHPPYEVAFRPAADHAVEMDLRPCVRGLAADRRRGVGAGVLSARFHETMARAIVGACVGVRSAGGPSTAALSGGCFSNRRLAERTRALLEESGFEVLTHRRVPPNDGGLALGQVAVAAARQRHAPRQRQSQRSA